jgi:hypothetical protein
LKVNLGQTVCKTLSQKNPPQKKGLVEWLMWKEHLPSKPKALNPNPQKKKKSLLAMVTDACNPRYQEVEAGG